MCLCDGVKTRIVTYEKCMFWSEKGNKRIYDAGWLKNILLFPMNKICWKIDMNI